MGDPQWIDKLPHEDSENELMFLAVFVVDDSHDLFGFDVVFEVDFETDQPGEKLCSSYF